MTQMSKALTHPQEHLPGGKMLFTRTIPDVGLRMSCLDIWRLPGRDGDLRAGKAKVAEQSSFRSDFTCDVNS